ncbi:cupin domain-containing protein [Xanthomonas cerealis]|uniref:cupin domain-containing protein n=1 Tax=Xanthomonas cerealis TaxID=3390025 RepID=UPI003976B369
MAAAVPGAQARPIKLTRAGSAASAVGPAAYFTGTVRIDAPFQGEAPARVGGATVSFEPGAHTVWHAHPLGQTLIVTAWRGFRRGGGRALARRQPQVAMTHIAIAEAVDGSPVTWLKPVSESQCRWE